MGAADSGSTFRINGRRYIYNLDAKQLGPGVYEVAIEINSAGGQPLIWNFGVPRP